jgi:ABC-2 type transport system ATP-binding protein
MIMSILFPDAGELSVLGHRSALAAKDRIGYLPEERGVYRKMRVGAFLNYMARLKGLSHAEATARVTRLLGTVGLAGTEGKRCEDMSKGMLQRMQFVAAILHQPDLLILDEPFSGLDPVSVRLLRDQIVAEHRRGATILLSTHVMAYAEEICQHVVMIHQGRKVLDEPMSGLKRQYDPRTIYIEPMAVDADVSALGSLSGVERVEASGDGYHVMLAPGTDPTPAMTRIAAAVPPARIELSRLRLEDVFVRIALGGRETGEDARALRARLQEGAEGVPA